MSDQQKKRDKDLEEVTDATASFLVSHILCRAAGCARSCLGELGITNDRVPSHLSSPRQSWDPPQPVLTTSGASSRAQHGSHREGAVFSTSNHMASGEAALTEGDSPPRALTTEPHSTERD